jgi:hypothetical protein
MSHATGPIVEYLARLRDVVDAASGGIGFIETIAPQPLVAIAD